MKRFTKVLLFLAIPVALVLLGGAWYARRNDASAASFRTAPVKRGDLVATISATGTVEPEEVIDVGAQVAGRVLEFGKDKNGKPIDRRSVVEEGMVLALIDPSVYQSEVDQSEAQLKQSQAGVAKAEADLGQMKAKLNQAERDWQRAQKLGPGDAMAQVDYDA